MYVCTLYVISDCKVLKTVMYPLELELQVIMRHQVGAGNQTLSSARTASALTTEQSLQPYK